MPSSDQIDCASSPSDSRSRARERERPRRVHPRAERRQDADAPVADLVAEALDDDGPVRGTTPVAASCSRRNVSRFCAARSSSECSLAQPLVAPSSSGSDASSRDALPIASPSSYGRPTPSPFQNGTAPGHAGRRRDEHAVARDLLDPPGRGAEQEGLARARLVDHLLVELADPAAAVHEVDAEEAAVGDRAGVRDREPPRAARGRGSTPAGRGPRRCAVAARRTRRTGSGPRACRARSRAGRARGRRTDRRRARGRAARRPRSPPASADGDDLLGEHVERVARDHASPRSRPRASARRRRPTRAGRRGTSGRSVPSRPRRARARRGRCAAGRARPTSATRPG